MALTQDNGKVFYTYQLDGTQDKTKTFAQQHKPDRKLRVSQDWLLYDYPSGADALVHPLHIGGLNDAIKHYKSLKAYRGGEGVKLDVFGFASNYAKDPRYDNEALASRRATNVYKYLIRNGVPAEDVSDPGIQVVGEKGQNKAGHRSAAVGLGRCANDSFAVVWYADKQSPDSFDFYNDELEIWDMDWGLAATYKIIPHGKIPHHGLDPAPPLDGQFYDTVHLNLLTGKGGIPEPLDAPEPRAFVPVTAFNGALVNFISTGGTVKMSGITTHEKVPFDAFGTSRAKSTPPFHIDDEALTAVLLLAKPTIESI